MAATEVTPLFSTTHPFHPPPSTTDPRLPLFHFLEGRSPLGLRYERFTIALIFLSVSTFIASSLFLPYNSDWKHHDSCGRTCDAIWFGNYENALSVLGLGNTSLVELLCVGVFTVDYAARFYTADLIHPKYGGCGGRLRFVVSFFSLVDLASTVPFYVDAFVFRETDWMASNFVRMFRLLRMMKVEGRYDLALGMVDDVVYGQRGIIAVALFVGVTVWGVMSSFFYLAERLNPSMIYCGAAPAYCLENQTSIDTSLCEIDSWGVVDCTAAGCPPTSDYHEPCWNVYRSIVSSSFWTLMELFGEFPLVSQHSVGGQLLGTITAVFACAVFALPAGIFGSGFESEIAKRRQDKSCIMEGSESSGFVEVQSIHHDVVGDPSTLRGSLYNFLHLQTTTLSTLFEIFMNGFIVGTTVVFMMSTVTSSNALARLHGSFRLFQLIAVMLFSLEYILLMYSATENPKCRGRGGMVAYAQDFFRTVDLLSILPYWIMVILSPILPNKHIALLNFAEFCLILRLFRFEKYSQAFRTFDDVIRDNLDVLTVTGFSAVLLWILFSSILYLTERNNPDEEMANHYKTVPNAMWITLLNLSGECPLAYYSSVGKIIVGIIGLFATAIFGVPIGVLGAGFEEIVTSQNEDAPDGEAGVDSSSFESPSANSFQVACYEFVNGMGSKSAYYFEVSIYVLIGATVTIGVIQTIDGYGDAFSPVELIAVIVFTVEYVMRFVGVGADPEFANESHGILKRLKFVISFYSVVDLMAIVPYYVAAAMPGSWVDQHDEYFRMLRLLRLLKLDKYVPSITLIDDVIRLKRRVLVVSCFAAATLWILFAGLMYLAEHQDHSMGIDNLPLYGCYENCSMSVRYENMFTSIPLTGIHLTGDFPMIEYDGFGRIILFFVVIAAVGVVAIPSGVIASGFSEIVNSKHRSTDNNQGNNAGDDWFDIKYRQLEGCPAPHSAFGFTVDSWQYSVKAYLDGKVDEGTGKHYRTPFSKVGRAFFFVLIVTNVLAIILESVPEIDRSVGNEKGNFFDVFEAWSVFFFTIDYILRLFSARKSREALYSPWVYATTFFGIVDLLTVAPWYIQMLLSSMGRMNGDEAKVFRIFRIFRVLQLEDFLVAFSKLDNVYRASKDVLKATGLMAIIIWVGSSALFFLFEQNNPNFRECDDSVPVVGTEMHPGCYDFESTMECNEFYPGMCSQSAFINMPNAMFYVAVFLGGEWGVVDFTWQGKLVCMFLCIAGIALYSIPVGTLFDSFGAVVGLSEEEEDEETEK
ncbi:hypothetical protein HJC23_009317 [Cyclotella cryptica]|uniref:Ion transport domain-containing protein n=1 Tax=Cyclotella cryptica TaxID=29204 RepID=A0ABD3QT15_9STRA